MDAVKNEIKTGKPTHGRFHTQKLNDILKALQRRVRAKDLNLFESLFVKALIKRIIKILFGK